MFKTVVKYEMFIALGARDSVIPLESHFNKKHEKYWLLMAREKDRGGDDRGLFGSSWSLARSI